MQITRVLKYSCWMIHYKYGLFRGGNHEIDGEFRAASPGVVMSLTFNWAGRHESRRSYTQALFFIIDRRLLRYPCLAV